MNEQMIAAFWKKLSEKAVFGPFMKTGDPAFVEAAGWAGWDFVILDMEHGPSSLENMQNNIRAAQISGVLPIVRVPALTPEAISKALDIGAAGVQIPQVSTVEDAQKAVQYAKYAPDGTRGVCRFVRAAHYSSLPRDTYFSTANQCVVIIQLEGQEAIDNLDGILAVKGVDIVFIGPYDLSQSLGVTGNTTHPKVVTEMKRIVEKALKAGITVGTFTDSEETLKMWRKTGVQYLSYSVDVGIFSSACAELASKFAQI